MSDARMRTCTGEELEMLTAVGWEHRETLMEDRQEMGQSYSTQEMVNGYSQYVNKMAPPVVVRRPVFLLGRSRDEEMAQLRRDLESAQEVRDDAVKSARADADGRTKAEKELTSMSKAHTEAVTARLDAEKRMADQATTMRKWEGDFAKIRKEIGEARFREILGIAK